MPDLAPPSPVSRRHLDILTDNVGIMQHAIGSRPDPVHGYCTDDVARALRVDLLHQRELGWAAVADSAWRNVRFLGEAFDGTVGRFRNFRRVDGSWLEGPGSEDCHGRAMLALGEAIAGAPDAKMVESATSLFSQALPAAQGLAALRAQASALLGCDAVMRAAPTGRTALAYRLMAGRLRSTFQSRAASAWAWPESRLTYENALPVQALIVAGRYLGSRPMVDAGLDLLDWLILAQTAPTGHLSPIGNRWWPCGGEKARFDQQPIEATALLLAAESAYLVTDDGRYRTAMERAYAWFLGENDLGLDVADPERGASCDGLTPRGVNTNQGAESTLMWLIAAEHIRAIRDGHATAQAWTEALLATSTVRLDRKSSSGDPRQTRSGRRRTCPILPTPFSTRVRRPCHPRTRMPPCSRAASMVAGR